MNRKSLFLSAGIVLTVAGGLLTASASADPVSVNNAGFETPVLDDGCFTFDNNAEWLIWSDNGSAGGIINPNSDIYANATVGTALGGDGANMLSLMNTTSANSAGDVVAFQDLGDTFQAGKTYTLTVAVGKRFSGLAPMDTFHLDIRTSSNTLLAQYVGTISDLTSGRFVDRSISYTVNSDDSMIGSGIRIMLGAANAANTCQQVQDFDNVRLVSGAVPEPSVLVLAASGLIGLLAYAWRKRK